MLTLGRVDEGHLEQVKGLKYPLTEFLGEDLAKDVDSGQVSACGNLVPYVSRCRSCGVSPRYINIAFVIILIMSID